jgi:hypothetical protein
MKIGEEIENLRVREIERENEDLKREIKEK